MHLCYSISVHIRHRNMLYLYLYSYFLCTYEYFRCSGKYPIPGYRIQSLCDPESSKPCCNTNDGACGITDHYCKCPECTDFREFRSTELLEWVTENDGCQIRNITTKEACEFFNQYNIQLTFIGEIVLYNIYERRVGKHTSRFTSYFQ